MENESDNEHPEMVSLNDYETPNLKLCAKNVDYVNTVIYEELGGRGSLRIVMNEIPTEVFALYLQSGIDKPNSRQQEFVLTWIDHNALSPSQGYGTYTDPDIHLTSEFLQLTRFYFQPKVSVLSSAVRSGQLNVCTSKFILSYLFGDENSLWDYESKCYFGEDDDPEDYEYDSDEEFEFQKQLADMDAYMDHMVFDFYKKPTACIKL